MRDCAIVGGMPTTGNGRIGACICASPTTPQPCGERGRNSLPSPLFSAAASHLWRPLQQMCGPEPRRGFLLFLLLFSVACILSYVRELRLRQRFLLPAANLPNRVAALLSGIAPRAASERRVIVYDYHWEPASFEAHAVSSFKRLHHTKMVLQTVCSSKVLQRWSCLL